MKNLMSLLFVTVLVSFSRAEEQKPLLVLAGPTEIENLFNLPGTYQSEAQIQKSKLANEISVVYQDVLGDFLQKVRKNPKDLSSVRISKKYVKSPAHDDLQFICSLVNDDRKISELILRKTVLGCSVGLVEFFKAEKKDVEIGREIQPVVYIPYQLHFVCRNGNEEQVISDKCTASLSSERENVYDPDSPGMF